MFRKSSSKSPKLQEVQRKAAELDAKIASIKKLPQQIKQEDEDQRNTLPPSDLIAERLREHHFEQLAGRGEISNTRRDAARHLWVMLALIVALVAMLWWAYQSMVRHGIF